MTKSKVTIKQLEARPSVWLMEGELGIINPFEETTTYFCEEKKSWKNANYNVSFMVVYQNHPSVEFIGFI